MPGPLSEHGELFQRRTPPTSLPPRLHRFVMAAPTSSGYSSFPFAPWPAFQAIYSDPPLHSLDCTTFTPALNALIETEREGTGEWRWVLCDRDEQHSQDAAPCSSPTGLTLPLNFADAPRFRALHWNELIWSERR